MKSLNRFLRWYSPKLYIRIGMARTRREHEEKLKTAKSSQERDALEEHLHHDFREWDEWLSSLEDSEMVEKAKRMDISLDDFPLPEFDKDDLYAIKNSHYYHGTFGDRLLEPKSRETMRKVMRERAPAYRKERREYWELWIKGGTLVMALIGSATGLIAVIKH